MSQREQKQFKFRIAATDDKASVTNFLKLYFFPDDPFTLGHKQPNFSGREFILSDTYFYHGTSVIAENDQNEMIGVIASLPFYKVLDMDMENLPEGKLKDIMKILDLLETKSDICNRYNVSKRLQMDILSVATNWRGYSIGQQLITKCMEIGQKLGYSVASLDCTNSHSIRLAEKLNMECVGMLAYEDFKDDEGIPIFKLPNNEKYIKKFCKRLSL